MDDSEKMIATDFASEAMRLHRRYVIEIVEELGFCPWARRARLDGHIREHVLLETEVDGAVDAIAAVITSWSSDEGAEVGFVIFPCLEVSRRGFDDLASRATEREASRHPVGKVPFVMAAFHPDAQPDTNTAERLIPFLRRTPDPCIQLVRTRVLDEVRANTPQGTRLFDMSLLDAPPRDEMPLRERIARSNKDTALELGLDELARKLDDIRADRDRTYAALRAR